MGESTPGGGEVVVHTNKHALGPVPDVKVGESTPGKPKALSHNKTNFVSGYQLTQLPPLTILPVVHALSPGQKAPL